MSAPACFSNRMAAAELQHALEVARAPWVSDLRSLRMLYRRIGRPGDGSDARYDTDAARAVGAQIFDEITKTRGAPHDQ